MIAHILTIGIIGWTLAGTLLIAGFAVWSMILDHRRGWSTAPPARGEIGS